MQPGDRRVHRGWNTFGRAYTHVAPCVDTLGPFVESKEHRTRRPAMMVSVSTMIPGTKRCAQTNDGSSWTSTPTCTASPCSRRIGSVGFRTTVSFRGWVFDMAGTSGVGRACHLRKSCLRTAPRPACYLSEPRGGRVPVQIDRRAIKPRRALSDSLTQL